MLENHIVKYGSIKKEKLYEAPFTILDSEGIEGVFEEANIMNDVFALVKNMNPEVPSMSNKEIKTKIDDLWMELYSSGITNPLTVIEQITFFNV